MRDLRGVARGIRDQTLIVVAAERRGQDAVLRGDLEEAADRPGGRGGKKFAVFDVEIGACFIVAVDAVVVAAGAVEFAVDDAQLVDVLNCGDPADQHDVGIHDVQIGVVVARVVEAVFRRDLARGIDLERHILDVDLAALGQVEASAAAVNCQFPGAGEVQRRSVLQNEGVRVCTGSGVVNRQNRVVFDLDIGADKIVEHKEREGIVGVSERFSRRIGIALLNVQRLFGRIVGERAVIENVVLVALRDVAARDREIVTRSFVARNLDLLAGVGAAFQIAVAQKMDLLVEAERNGRAARGHLAALAMEDARAVRAEAAVGGAVGADVCRTELHIVAGDGGVGGDDPDRGMRDTERRGMAGRKLDALAIGENAERRILNGQADPRRIGGLVHVNGDGGIVGRIDRQTLFTVDERAAAQTQTVLGAGERAVCRRLDFQRGDRGIDHPVGVVHRGRAVDVQDMVGGIVLEDAVAPDVVLVDVGDQPALDPQLVAVGGRRQHRQQREYQHERQQKGA